ncbi:S-adenosyl-L-methionine-dependent methyltransferase [Bisporella sp. PMI_857]|nr:S-adenosyl-L-methionine-dependent methyltransferase [Bisporella sp. PMI_857]
MSNTTLVAEWYNKNASLENNRLISGKLEFALTLKTILSFLSMNNASLQIADIGGGTGRYAIELAKLDHKVTLCDISQRELALAAENVKAANVTLEAIVCADASKLRESSFFEKEKFDAVLLLGPLYHLLEREERVAVLANCAAMTKTNGIIFASFITKFGHLRDVARRDPGRLVQEKEFYETYLENGRYERRKDNFSHHSHPDEIRDLFREIPGLNVEKLVACESFLGFWVAEGLNGLCGEEFQDWVDVVGGFADDPCVLGASEHILVVARRV